MRTPWVAFALTLLMTAFGARADATRDGLFLQLVKDRHIPSVDKANRAAHVGPDALWVGCGLRVARRAEVEGAQIDTGQTVGIEEFEKTCSSSAPMDRSADGSTATRAWNFTSSDCRNQARHFLPDWGQSPIPFARVV